ncbi:cytochrome P450 [Gigaspora margarita]|uniref:Cytochrome P450 n=1 Tax=Gigaspora margarita TaxID=4874 RepID=A0A8H4B4N8_GIGMA|nr:cytochrome P450 [Gigaspora margarita]
MAIQNIINLIYTVDYYLLFIAFITIYIFNFYYKYLNRPNPLPGPIPLPFIGNFHNLLYDPKKFYEQSQSKYGDISEVNLDRRFVLLTRPEYFEKLFDRKLFFMRQSYNQGLEEIGMFGHGIAFNENYENWKPNNKFFMDTFVAQKFMDNAVNSTNNLYKELSDYWQSLGKQNTSNNNNDNWTLETDFTKWLHGFTNDIVSIIITGERTYSIAAYYNSLSLKKSEYPDAIVEDGDRFVKSIVKYIQGLMLFSSTGSFVRQYIPIIKNKSVDYIKNRDYLFEKLDKIIKKRKEDIKKMTIDKEMRTDMLTSLITANTNLNDSNDEELKPIADIEIRGNILDAFLGGTDTTTNLFCFITYFICKNPHVKQKMLSEIDCILTSDKSYVSYNDLQKLRYCEAIIKETSRLVPVIPVGHRLITEEYEIAGYKWPPGTHFMLNFSGVHTHPKIWPDPEVFNPDRFYNDDLDDKKLGDKSALVIFGGGRRICPGRRLAMLELLSLMALVFKNYNVELVNKNEPLKLITLMTTTCQELKVRISPRP